MAAAYSPTDEAEVRAVITLENKLNLSKVRSNLEVRDKIPNIDGSIDLIEKSRRPIGKLEVQVKTIGDTSEGAPKYQCPLSLFTYSEGTCNPVLLIGVDIENEKAFWVHIQNELLEGREIRTGQKTLNIDFPDENIIDGEDEKYVDEWTAIVKEYQAKIRGFDELHEKYAELLRITNPALLQLNSLFDGMHMFLDKYNDLLDNEFNVIKDIIYPNSWKVGLAYSSYEENSLTYTLYPIPKFVNDVQIKIIEEEKWNEYRRRYGLSSHFVENPIRSRPVSYAYQKVESNLLKIIKNQELSFIVNEFMANEYIFNFMDYNLGRSKTELVHEHDITDVIDMMDGIVRDVERPQGKKYAREEYPYLRISFGRDSCKFKPFVESVFLLEELGVKKLMRPYVPFDYDRIRSTSGYIFNLYSKEELESSIKTYYDNLYDTYTQILNRNFPLIIDDINYLRNVSRIIVVINSKDKYLDLNESPYVYEYHLHGEAPFRGVEVYQVENFEHDDPINQENFNKPVDFEGVIYTIRGIRLRVVDFIFHDLPMYSTMYREIEDRLRRFLEYKMQVENN